MIINKNVAPMSCFAIQIESTQINEPRMQQFSAGARILHSIYAVFQWQTGKKLQKQV